ncbi:hypothetical protein V8E52_011903 [Russula decolorans]
MPPEHAPLIGHGHETHLFSGLESILSLCKPRKKKEERRSNRGGTPHTAKANYSGTGENSVIRTLGKEKETAGWGTAGVTPPPSSRPTPEQQYALAKVQSISSLDGSDDSKVAIYKDQPERYSYPASYKWQPTLHILAGCYPPETFLLMFLSNWLENPWGGQQQRVLAIKGKTPGSKPRDLSISWAFLPLTHLAAARKHYLRGYKLNIYVLSDPPRQRYSTRESQPRKLDSCVQTCISKVRPCLHVERVYEGEVERGMSVRKKARSCIVGLDDGRVDSEGGDATKCTLRYNGWVLNPSESITPPKPSQAIGTGSAEIKISHDECMIVRVQFGRPRETKMTILRLSIDSPFSLEPTAYATGTNGQVLETNNLTLSC